MALSNDRLRFNIQEIMEELNVSREQVLEWMSERHVDVVAYNNFFDAWLPISIREVRKAIGNGSKQIKALFLVPNKNWHQFDIENSKTSLPAGEIKFLGGDGDNEFPYIWPAEQWEITFDNLSVPASEIEKLRAKKYDALKTPTTKSKERISILPVRSTQDNSFSASEDFSHVKCKHGEFIFSSLVQAPVVKYLFKKFEAKNPVADQGNIFHDLNIDNYERQITKAFRKHSALGTLLKSPKNGFYCLDLGD